MIADIDSRKKQTSCGAVVITGASTGIGKACALRLAGAGFAVFAGVRREVDGVMLREACGERLTPLLLDVTNGETVAAAVNTVETAVGKGGMVGLVNNAGVAVGGPLEFLPMDEVEWQMEVNFFGAIRVTQAFLPLLRRGQGRIVNMSSIAGRSALPFLGPYSASKFALKAVSDAMRLELRPWHIHVALVEPGSVATPIWQKGLETADRLLKRLPEQAHLLYGPIFPFMHKTLRDTKGSSPDEVAKAVEHALTAKRPQARYLVGGDAKFRTVLERLPTPWRDGLISSRLPKYGTYR